MADIGVWTKNADIQAKAGNKANTTAKAVAATDVYVLEVESLVNCICRFNFSNNYAALNADVKNILKGVTSDLCAIYVIQWDMSGYTSRIEAENMVNILRDSALRGLSILRDKKTQDFINGA
jgi:hypothetical protein